KGDVIGKELKEGAIHVFFGNKRATTELLKSLYPNYEFHFLKQVHGDRLEKAPATGPADAHWTDKPNQAVAVYTADCLPALIYWPQSRRAAAIHAGWRGVAAEILPKTLRAFGSETDTRVFVGPHIRMNSFEVHDDVATTLARVGPADVLHPHQEPGKKYVDLTSIARFQFERNGISAQRQFFDDENTCGNPEYYSYRGDRANCGRLISFIALTNGDSNT
ncbi:MAG TPA: polyphenol oxidase family protein, partial [Bdellovibrionales bacterium]|nr:polyphenol oxidase family protein [Bdellovibrionales bacterium]